MIRLVLKSKNRAGLVPVKKRTSSGAMITFWMKPVNVKDRAGGLKPDTAPKPKAGKPKESSAPKIKTISAGEWKTAKKHDYATIKEGQRYILEGGAKGTQLTPVHVTGLPKPPASHISGEKMVARMREIVSGSTALKIKGKMIDMQTANVVTKVYDALGAENKKKFAGLSLGRMIDISWKLANR